MPSLTGHQKKKKSWVREKFYSQDLTGQILVGRRGAHATFSGTHGCVLNQVPRTQGPSDPPQKWSIRRTEDHPDRSPAQRQEGWHRVCPLRPVQSLMFVKSSSDKSMGRERRHLFLFASLHSSPGHCILDTREGLPCDAGDALLSDGTCAYSL